MIFRGHIFIGAVLLAIVAAAQDARAAEPNVGAHIVSCIPIHTATQLQAMQNDLTATYCLANDIDASSIARFVPVGDEATPFTGSLFGNDHIIRNLRIKDSTHKRVGLFGQFSGGSLRDVNLANVSIEASAESASVGGLAGFASSPISHVSVTGKVSCSDFSCNAGGIAGEMRAPLALSWSSAEVTGGFQAGGVAAFYTGDVSDSFATGNVNLTSVDGPAGGLLGQGSGAVTRSFATGNVSAPGFGTSVGGLIGSSNGSIRQSFATGRVTGGPVSSVGGLLGVVGTTANVNECYAVGPVASGPSSKLGGLVGVASGSVLNSYWDVNTSGQMTSAGGTGLSTAQLRSTLPVGFDPATWAINRALSYPFLDDADLVFNASLATLVVAKKVYAFLPIGQRDVSQYRRKPLHANQASLAAVYAMLARAVGTTQQADALQSSTIDTFWNDRTQTTTFAGPIVEHAALGPLVELTGQIGNGNVTGALKQRHLVILRGSFMQANGRTATHWMLATLYTRNNDNSLGPVIANDPWTGQQVEIDPVTKRVIAPSDFPLANFKVNGLRTVTVH
jgi:hypothetical protein